MSPRKPPSMRTRPEKWSLPSKLVPRPKSAVISVAGSVDVMLVRLCGMEFEARELVFEQRWSVAGGSGSRDHRAQSAFYETVIGQVYRKTSPVPRPSVRPRSEER